jgi:hypothetical protein
MRIITLTLFTGAALALAQKASRQDGIGAFSEMTLVLTSPRCINCHVPANSPPLQGDDSHPHSMKVVRGEEGKGGDVVARCSNCHQDANVSTPHAPPGAPGWRMPAGATPMAWQGLSNAQVCRALKDRQTNGKRSPAELLEHVTSDKIVNWAWNPGAGRAVPPLSPEQFVQASKLWVAAGAPCPE